MMKRWVHSALTLRALILPGFGKVQHVKRFHQSLTSDGKTTICP
jgi:hypothetical protein